MDGIEVRFQEMVIGGLEFALLVSTSSSRGSTDSQRDRNGHKGPGSRRKKGTGETDRNGPELAGAYQEIARVWICVAE